MTLQFDALENYKQTREKVGYVDFKNAKPRDYESIGFMSGLEIHQQLKTDKKLFCRCPAGIYQSPDDYDAELLRHMRPTLSELGEYDGTALMEFKTRKNIFYRIKNETACTYDIDDTPPFKINDEALRIAIKISLLCKMSIVGELHIARKQYLDGSIPTGFQRTGIVGIEGEIPIKNKKIRLMQLSIEEDSCREVSDIGHDRIYRTDRLGMPLIETVTYPDMKTPQEVAEAAHYLRYLVRSTNHVLTGMGAARQDVNVSVTGGTRVEIKGVAHIKLIPLLTHNEAFRQRALLDIKDDLNKRVKSPNKWGAKSAELDYDQLKSSIKPIRDAKLAGKKLIAVNLPKFHGILSHFTQPSHTFGSEISDRLKVIACLEHPNMLSSEMQHPEFFFADGDYIKNVLNVRDNDAQLIFWANEDDVETAIETIEERCRMAFDGIPNETRKSLPDGTTIFERVLPGADRMYPDTDTAPVAIDESYIDEISKELPTDVINHINQLKIWNVPEDANNYILKNNLMSLIHRIIDETDYDPKFVVLSFAHRLKYIEGQINSSGDFNFKKIYGLFLFLKEQKIEVELIHKMLGETYKYPNIEFSSLLEQINFKRYSEKRLKSYIGSFDNKFDEICHSKDPKAKYHWVMGQLRDKVLGNIPLSRLSGIVSKELTND
jgi:glutamyl-tRNA(Gln) amidotransferase subunit E